MNYGYMCIKYNIHNISEYADKYTMICAFQISMSAFKEIYSSTSVNLVLLTHQESARILGHRFRWNIGRCFQISKYEKSQNRSV